MEESMKLIVKTIFGSKLYGTATPTSDHDVRGVFMPSKREILLGRIPKTNKDSGGNGDDFELYSLHHFVKLACDGQTVALDMLWTPPSLTSRGEAAHIWDELVSNRHKFLSKNMNAFIGYARGQAAKYSLKGERLEKLRTFNAILMKYDEDEPLSKYIHELPRDDERFSPSGVLEIQICGKWYGATTQVQFVRESINSMIAGYGTRTQAAADSGGIDWKALSHAVRVTIELDQLLREGRIVFPLEWAETIRNIKLGKSSLESVQRILDIGLQDIEELTAKSDLPKEVDREFWDNWLADVIGREIV